MQKTILLVDDDAAVTRLFSMYLRGEYDVLTADSGVGAVETVEASAVDLVVMDLAMPGLDGWMAMSLIRARRPTMPFIVVTSTTDKDVEERAKHAGAVAFLRKPASADDLKRAVGRALG